MTKKMELIKKRKYLHYNDYTIKRITYARANGILKFIGLPYKIINITLSELTNLDAKIHRLDFAGEVEKKNGERISVILEFQTKVPNMDDYERFFQYAANLRIYNKKKVEIYIICMEKTDITKKEFVLNDECTFIMNLISLKNFRAEEIFKNIEYKLKNNVEITDEDIASLQLIVYTDYEETKLEIINRAYEFLERIGQTRIIDINEKDSIKKILNTLSANMLSDEELKEYSGVKEMFLDPVDRYAYRKGIDEGIEQGIEQGMEKGMEKGIEQGASNEKIRMVKKLIKNEYEVGEIVKLTDFSKKEIEKIRDEI